MFQIFNILICIRPFIAMPAIIIQVKDIKLIKFDLTMLRIFQYLFK